MPDDKNTLLYAFGTLQGQAADRPPKTVWLHNTLCLEEFYISEALLEQAKQNTKLKLFRTVKESDLMAREVWMAGKVFKNKNEYSLHKK